jgi:hypothetical protein
MKQFIVFLVQSFIFISFANAEVQYFKGENCEYTKNKKTRVLPSTLISISESPLSKGINFFNVIEESGALLVGLSQHEYYVNLELEYPMYDKVSPEYTFSLKYDDAIKYYGYSGNYVRRAMAIVSNKEEIKKIEFVLWDNSRQSNEDGGVTLNGVYRYKCENVSSASPEFVQSIASNSLQFSLKKDSDDGRTGFVYMTLPFSYTDNVKGLDFEDSFSIIYKVKGPWRDKTITKIYTFSDLLWRAAVAPRFEIKTNGSKDNINFDKSLTFFDQTPNYVPKDSIETRLVFERKYKSSSRPSLKIEKKL